MFGWDRPATVHDFVMAGRLQKVPEEFVPLFSVLRLLKAADGTGNHRRTVERLLPRLSMTSVDQSASSEQPSSESIHMLLGHLQHASYRCSHQSSISSIDCSGNFPASAMDRLKL